MGRVSATDGIAVGALVVSIISAGMSGYAYWDQTRARHELGLLVTHVEMARGDGRLGSGPKLIAGVSFINTGNQPVLVHKVTAAYGGPATDADADDCKITSTSRWVGTPWLSRLKEEQAFAAAPFSIGGNEIEPAIFSFEPVGLPVAPTPVPSQIFKVCLRVSAANANGHMTEESIFIGTIDLASANLRMDYSVNWRDRLFKLFQ